MFKFQSNKSSRRFGGRRLRHVTRSSLTHVSTTRTQKVSLRKPCPLRSSQVHHKMVKRTKGTKLCERCSAQSQSRHHVFFGCQESAMIWDTICMPQIMWLLWQRCLDCNHTAGSPRRFGLSSVNLQKCNRVCVYIFIDMTVHVLQVSALYCIIAKKVSKFQERRSLAN